MSVKFIVMATLVTALVALTTCKREERTFSVPIADAKTTQSSPNTPVKAGGATAPVLTYERPSPRPEGLESNAYALAQGKLLYEAMNCAGCHAAGGGGGIGPALSDEEWIYGWEPEVIFDSIVYGRPNGMPSFSGRIPDQQVWQIVAYVRSLSGLASRQAAPGRGDHLSGGPPPNSVSRASPRSSSSERDELRRRDQAEFERLGWTDPRSGEVWIPESTVQAVARQSAKAATTRPATPPSKQAPSPTSTARDPKK